MIGDFLRKVDSVLPAFPWQVPKMHAATAIEYFNIREGGGTVQVHLRTDANGHGTLFINANYVYHLNPTAAHIARGVLRGEPADQIKKRIGTIYNVRWQELDDDFAFTSDQIQAIIHDSTACPIHTLEVEHLPPFQVRPTAPYRMDLAVTYRCNNDCPHCYNARERTFSELDTVSTKRMIDKMWQLGIPHIVFTGGEPTLRADLAELVGYASGLGLICGMNTNARRLIDREYVSNLVDAGLDHLQVTVESYDPEVHNRMVNANAFDQTIRGLRNALDTRLYVMTNTTMLRENVATIPETLDFLASIGVPTIGLNALIYSGHGKTVGTGLNATELSPILQMATQKTVAAGQRLIWYTPTQYCGFDPQGVNLGVKGCTAALYNMCLEPNGDVLPCQSYYTPVGNILTDDWQTIWQHPLCVSLRERQNVPAKCNGCGLFSECGGGCPLENESEERAAMSLNVIAL